MSLGAPLERRYSSCEKRFLRYRHRALPARWLLPRPINAQMLHDDPQERLRLRREAAERLTAGVVSVSIGVARVASRAGRALESVAGSDAGEATARPVTGPVCLDSRPESTTNWSWRTLALRGAIRARTSWRGQCHARGHCCGGLLFLIVAGWLLQRHLGRYRRPGADTKVWHLRYPAAGFGLGAPAPNQ